MIVWMKYLPFACQTSAPQLSLSTLSSALVTLPCPLCTQVCLTFDLVTWCLRNAQFSYKKRSPPIKPNKRERKFPPNVLSMFTVLCWAISRILGHLQPQAMGWAHTVSSQNLCHHNSCSYFRNWLNAISIHSDLLDLLIQLLFYYVLTQ